MTAALVADLDPATADRLRRALDVDRMIAVCREVVRIPSLSGEEAAVASVLAGHLERLGYDRVEIDANGNVVAWLDGAGGGPSLLFNGHLDHVPPAGMADPFSAAIVDAARWGESGQAIVGRGTCDMKGNVVAAAFAGAAVRAAGIPLRGTFVFNADVAEEIDSPAGVQSVIARGVRADYGLSGEATGLRVSVGHRGKVEFALTVHGRAAHSSEPSRGVNAISLLAPLLQALDAHAQSLPAHDLLGAGTLAPIDVRASPGGGVAVIPDRCTLRVDRRFIPAETPAGCRAELEEIVARLRATDPAFACDVEQVNLYPLFFTPPDHPLVAAARAARASELGSPGDLGAWRFGVNGTFMSQAGIPTIGFGAGNEQWAHTPEEHVLVDELVAAARVYARLIVGVCGVAG